MENGWEIIEGEGSENELRIWVNGVIIETHKSASVRWLSESAPDFYKKAYNSNSKDGWKIA